jgi:hypothetical protein
MVAIIESHSLGVGHSTQLALAGHQLALQLAHSAPKQALHSELSFIPFRPPDSDQTHPLLGSKFVFGDMFVVQLFLMLYVASGVVVITAILNGKILIW